MSRLLPPSPSLRYLKERAKDMLKAHHQGDVSACETLRLLKRLAGASDADILRTDVSLL